MALAGNIKEFGLADIFQIVSLQQKTGELTVEGPQGKVMILLENGFIVGADSTSRPIEERLQQSLSRSQTASKFHLKRAIETQKKTLQPFWTVLAETKAIDIETLQNMLSLQIHETIYYVLRWTEGEYRFEPKKTVEYDRQLISPINTEFLVMEGFRITDEWSEIEKKIPSLQLVIRRTGSVSPDGLSEAEAKVYNLLTTERTIQDIIDTSQQGEFDTCQIIYDLMKKNLVESVKSKKGKTSQVRRISFGLMDILGRVATVILAILLVVGIIVGFRYVPIHFAAIHTPNFHAIGAIKRITAQSHLNSFTRLIPLYFLKQQALPKSFEDLQNLDLISSSSITDPWGNAYMMIPETNRVVIRSSGSDEIPETDDDLSMTITF